MRPEAIDDIFLIVGMAMIAWGFWDITRLMLVFGGTLIIFLVLRGGTNGDEGETIGRSEETTGGIRD